MDQVDEPVSSQLLASVAGREDEKTLPTNTDLLAALAKTMQKSNPWISVPNAKGKFKTALSFRGSPLEKPGGSPNINDDEKEKQIRPSREET